MPLVGGACSSDMLAVVAHERVCVDCEDVDCVRLALEDSFFSLSRGGVMVEEGYSRQRGIIAEQKAKSHSKQQKEQD